jgi:hypothetical protein
VGGANFDANDVVTFEGSVRRLGIFRGAARESVGERTAAPPLEITDPVARTVLSDSRAAGAGAAFDGPFASPASVGSGDDAAAAVIFEIRRCAARRRCAVLRAGATTGTLGAVGIVAPTASE